MSSGRYDMYNKNKFKIGLFGANCSSGRAIVKNLPERWRADWDSCSEMARLADEGGVDFILPIGRWRGYGGESNFQGSTYETITWATGLLAQTKRVTIFGTVHAPIFNPLVAAKMMMTADHIGHGRFGLNIVVGWNEPEFQMMGHNQREHDARYDYADEWISAMKRMWTDGEPFDFDGDFLHLKNVVSEPKMTHREPPLLINAGSSDAGKNFSLRHCHGFFTNFVRRDPQNTIDFVQNFKNEARAIGREINVFTQGHVVCRPTRQEAEDYYRYFTTEGADFDAIDTILRLKNITPENTPNYQEMRRAVPYRNIGYPIVGSPDDVAEKLAEIHNIGISGIAFSLVNYVKELPLVTQEVLPRLQKMGLRA
jgi:alkanesulfonate monooxygenase SsuD/methylene tetrahydromethanopterin reductase-like flavin-dependent oxidoreductase (luciferase family)